MDYWQCCFLCVYVYENMVFQCERLTFFWTWRILDRLSASRPLRVKENAHCWTIITTIIIIIIIFITISIIIDFFCFFSSWMLQSLFVQLYISYSGRRTFWLMIQALYKESVSWTHWQTVLLKAGFELVIPERVLPQCTLRGWTALLAAPA
jgi:hypothetical protein